MTALSDTLSAALNDRLTFLNEADKLKSISRANLIISGQRQENSAEHSWHLMLYALVFADQAAAGVDVDRAISMLMLHDLVEIDAGDHPIHLAHDPAAIAEAEHRAADRLFGLLPTADALRFHALRDEFEAGTSPTAAFARRLDIAQPILQTLACPSAPDWHRDVVRENLTTGRAVRLSAEWPEMHGHGLALLDGQPSPASDDFLARIAFLSTACGLKSVDRATRLHDNTRCENSAEHCWHIALHADLLADYAAAPVNRAKVVRMMILHDLVEIWAGDTPIHGTVDHAAQAAAEQAAADRLFGMLPAPLGHRFMALWQEFEAAQTPEAIYAKAIDRTSAPLANLANGGGSWVDYSVSYDQLVTRVGTPVRRGAPAVWAELDRRIRAYPFFANR